MMLRSTTVWSFTIASVVFPLAGAASLYAQDKPGHLASEPDLRELIVSHADQNNRLQLYRVKEDGSSKRQITDSRNDCMMPAWSPDGEKIVYARKSDKGLDLWLISSDGKNARALTETGRNVIPSWLPDSKHIVWMVFTPGNNPLPRRAN